MEQLQQDFISTALHNFIDQEVLSDAHNDTAQLTLALHIITGQCVQLRLFDVMTYRNAE